MNKQHFKIHFYFVDFSQDIKRELQYKINFEQRKMHNEN